MVSEPSQPGDQYISPIPSPANRPKHHPNIHQSSTQDLKMLPIFRSAPMNQAPPQVNDQSPLDPLNNWPVSNIDEIFREDDDVDIHAYTNQIDWASLATQLQYHPRPYRVVADLVKFVLSFLALTPVALLIAGLILAGVLAAPFLVVLGIAVLSVVLSGVVLFVVFVVACVGVPGTMGAILLGVHPDKIMRYL
ncbi:hypothetical protein BJX96DRAFT_116868 [Aspergillus floccosus]